MTSDSYVPHLDQARKQHELTKSNSPNQFRHHFYSQVSFEFHHEIQLQWEQSWPVFESYVELLILYR